MTDPKFDPTDFKLIAHFHLRSGTVLDVHCDNLKTNTSGGDLESYNMQGVARGQLMYIRLNDVSAITYTVNPKWVGK